MRLNKTLTLLLLPFLALTLFQCSEDSAPTQVVTLGEISGEIVFAGQWPAVGEVQVSAWTAWPPAGPPAANTAALQGSSNATIAYKLDGLSKGMYGVITVGWRDPANPQGAKVLGVYVGDKTTAGVDSTGAFTGAPVAIEVKDGSMIHGNVDIMAELTLAK